MINGKEYLEHRLAWFYTLGVWPERIDHVNGVKDDNRLSNLRECTIAENNQNRRRKKNNKSGHKGVSWHSYNKRWRSQITVQGKDTHLGYFLTKEEAADAYNDAALQHHGEFARFDL